VTAQTEARRRGGQLGRRNTASSGLSFSGAVRSSAQLVRGLGARLAPERRTTCWARTIFAGPSALLGSPVPAIRAVDLDDLHAPGAQEAGQPHAEAAAAFDASVL
jgi:hypothetical protein